MARLNESTASAEPIEILKRRFVRQNREIARVNSIQSLRIRSLESEVSHLLSENVALREQIITMTQDLERFEAAKALHHGVYDVKSRLDNKLVELSGLITELGRLPRRYSKTTRETAGSAPERRPRAPSSTRKNNDADLEPTLGLESDGRLPVILEDKHYPRSTLSAQELQELSNSDPNIPCSPRLGNSAISPPKSTECGEVPTEVPTDVVGKNAAAEYMEDEHLLPPNLETRRKKRIASTTTNKEQDNTNSMSLLDSRFTRKCGAKRKFSAEDEENFFESAPAEDDGFEFSRPVQSPASLSSQNEHSSMKRETHARDGTAISDVQPKRKVLEPKSTNTSMISPAKPSITKNYDQYQDSASPRNNENSFPQHDKGGQNYSKNASPKKAKNLILSEHRGADHDKQEAKEVGIQVPLFHDVQPPEASDLPNIRPSRRRGAVVSYAEPNLRDKMRRSTNELGPAVSRDRARKSSLHTDSDQEPHEKWSKNNSTKKSRGSSLANDKHSFTGDKIPYGQPRRSLNSIPGKKCQRFVDDGSKDDAESQSQGLDAPSENKMRNQMADSIPHSQDSHQSFTHSPSDISTNVDQAASFTSKKSRRHSSNTKSSKRSIAPRSLTNSLSVEGVCNDLTATHSGSGSPMNEHYLHHRKADNFTVKGSQEYTDTSSLTVSTEMSWGQRVAARRRSMML